MPINLSNLSPEERRQFLDFLRRVGVQLEDIRNTYSQFSQEAKDHLRAVKEAYKVQTGMKDGINGLVKGLKKVSDLQKEITALEKEAARVEGEKKEILEEEIKQLRILQKSYAEQFKTVNKTNIVLKEMSKALGAMPKAISTGFNRLKGTGIFEMDKSIKKSALSMGLLGSRSEEFYGNIQSAQDAAISLGVTIQELAEMQAVYSDELGRSVLLGKEGLEAITLIAKGTGLGAEAAAKMAGEFDSQGLSAEKTAKFMEQTMNDASSMGLNSSKVVKNIQGNIRLLNRYNFKGGVKGLAKMAETVTKLGMDMNSIAPMVDKLFNIEGAVEMSAQLQVLGGRWSQLADPFKLMYQARNDMNGLVKSIGEAAAQSASLDEDGNIELASVEMARLRQVAETTGISYDELAEAAKRAGKAAMIKSKLSMTGLNEEEQEFLTNIAEFEDGRAFIMLNGEKKFLDQLDVSTKSLIQSKRQEQKSLKERAEQAISFDERIDFLITQLKQSLLPLAKDLADPKKGLAKSLIDFRDWLVREKVGQRIGEFAVTISQFVAKVADVLGPKGIVGVLTGWAALKIATWVANGVALGKGFLMATRGFGSSGNGSGGGIADSLFGGNRGLRGGIGRISKAFSRGGFSGGMKAISRIGNATLKGNAFTAALSGLFDIGSNLSEGKGVGESIGRALLTTGGSLLGGFLGSLVAPGAGTIGGGIGGGMLGGKLADLIFGEKINDGVIFNPKDKFMKVNDGTMIAGTNVNGNKSLAKALMTTMVPAAQTSSIPGEIKLSDLNVTGSIELKLQGNSASLIGKELLNDPIFIRNIARAINMATANAVSGTQKQKPAV